MMEAELAVHAKSVLADISVYEAIDLQLQRWALAQHTEEMIVLSTTIYLTVVSAFLGAAYVGGARLTRPQAIIASSVFTSAGLFSAQQVYAFFNEFDSKLRHIGEIYLQMAHAYNKPAWVATGQGVKADAAAGMHEYILLGLMVLGILASLYFMWSVRHPRKN
jgi:hypothetical protein